MIPPVWLSWSCISTNTIGLGGKPVRDHVLSTLVSDSCWLDGTSAWWAEELEGRRGHREVYQRQGLWWRRDWTSLNWENIKKTLLSSLTLTVYVWLWQSLNALFTFVNHLNNVKPRLCPSFSFPCLRKEVMDKKNKLHQLIRPSGFGGWPEGTDSQCWNIISVFRYII